MNNYMNYEYRYENLRECINNYSSYIDFETVYNNIKKYQNEISLLSVLVGSKNIKDDFKKLIQDHPNVLKIIPTMLAKREKIISFYDGKRTIDLNFNTRTQSISDYEKFMEKSGLFELLKNHITNLTAFFVGIETFLNSNIRKNSDNQMMRNLVEGYIKKAGFIKNKTYFKEMYLSDLEKMTGLNLSKLSNAGSVANRFDFVIIGKECVYACECNFYASGGSKLNEIARSYKTLALESQNIKGFKFVWFTDGIGWKSAKNNLKETFDVLEDLYNINDLENDIILKKIK